MTGPSARAVNLQFYGPLVSSRFGREGVCGLTLKGVEIPLVEPLVPS